MAKNEKSPFVAITSITGGILLSILAVFMIFAKEVMAAVVPTVVWGLVVLGIVMGFFAYKKK
jgi:hypothetical protein